MTINRINIGVLGVYVYEISSRGIPLVSYWAGLYQDDMYIGSRILIADIRVL